jgi:endonuclease YncB( thermonuclease family)
MTRESEVPVQILAILFIAAAAISQAPLSAKRSDPVLVRVVFDGDTIDVSNIGRVRLLGIDAPEIGRGLDTSAPFSREAREKLASLVLGRWVRLEQDGPVSDAYNRRLAYVIREDGVLVNAVLLREGLARLSARAPLTRLPELEKAQVEAQALRRGMWGAAPSLHGPSYTRPLPPISPRGSQASKPKRSGKAKPKTSHGRRSR